MNTWTAPLFPEDPPPSTQEIKRHNDDLGLTAIAKFGWLRPREIGNVLWAGNSSRHVAGARIARRWVKNKLVIERKLPYGLGNAYVLSQRGAEYLEAETQYGLENDIKSGKKIGDHIEQSSTGWIPSLSWRHDLLANGFLTMVMGYGGHVVSELELRRETTGGKIPDGLYTTPESGHYWFAIEVERAGKWSTNARSVATSIIETALYQTVIAGREVMGTVLVYEDPKVRHWRDESRPVVDHFGRVERQCKALIDPGSQINLVGIPLVTSGGGVIDVSEPQHRTIGWSIEATIEKSVFLYDWVNWREQYRLLLPEGCPVSLLMSYEEDGGWTISLAGKYIDLGEYTESAAKQAALRHLGRNPNYRGWARENALDLLKRLKES